MQTERGRTGNQINPRVMRREKSISSGAKEVKTIPTTQRQRFLSVLGLAKKAGAGVFGASAVCERVRSAKKPAAVFLASDASAGTIKRIRDKCAFYGVDCRAAPVTMEELGAAVGMRLGTDACGAAAAAVTDRGLASLALERLSELLSHAPPGDGGNRSAPPANGNVPRKEPGEASTAAGASRATAERAADIAAADAAGDITDTAAKSADEGTSISNQGDGGNN